MRGAAATLDSPWRPPYTSTIRVDSPLRAFMSCSAGLQPPWPARIIAEWPASVGRPDRLRGSIRLVPGTTAQYGLPSMPPGRRNSVYLVDAHSLIFQVFHAIRGMTSPSGLPTNAVFGFARDLLFLRSLQPDYLVCAFDRSEPTFRSDLYADYKAHRDADARRPAAADCRSSTRCWRRWRIPVLSHPGYEADDVLATLATAGAAARHRRLHLHQRQGLPAAHRRPRPPVQPAQARRSSAGPNCWPTGASRPSRWSISSAGRRLGGQRARRARHRRQDGGQAAAGVRHPRQHPRQRRQGLRREAAGEPARAAADDRTLSRQLVRLADRRAARRSTGTAGGCSRWTRRGCWQLFREWGFRSLADQVRDAPAGRSRRQPARCRPAAERPVRATPRRSCSPSAPTPPTSDGRLAGGRRPPTAADAWQATYHLVDTPEKFDDVLAGAAPAEALRHRPGDDRASSRCEAEIVGFAFSLAGRARRSTWPCAARTGGRCSTRTTTLDAAAAVLEDAGGRQGQPEHQVRPAGAARPGRRACAAWPATRWWPTTSCTPASAAITWRSWHVAI